ncbi:hypothetical protein Tco_0758850 [Tanacetum coccineum]
MLRKQHKVDEYHNDMPLIYYVEGHSLHFGRPEFCSYTSTDLKFRNRVFPHKVGLLVTILDVLSVIEYQVMFGNLCDEDSVCLCLILALEVIFIGRLLTCPVDDSLFRLVENLEAWNVFPWGEHEYLVDEELKLCLEEEERIRSEQEKRIQQEKRLRLEEEKMLRLEEEKMLQNAEDVSRLFHSMDTIWLSDNIERFISQPGQLKSMFPWSDDYTISRNFWLRLVCLDPCRKGWLSEEHIDLWVDYMWHGRRENANWAMVKIGSLLCVIHNWYGQKSILTIPANTF